MVVMVVVVVMVLVLVLVLALVLVLVLLTFKVAKSGFRRKRSQLSTSTTSNCIANPM